MLAGQPAQGPPGLEIVLFWLLDGQPLALGAREQGEEVIEGGGSAAHHLWQQKCGGDLQHEQCTKIICMLCGLAQTEGCKCIMSGNANVALWVYLCGGKCLKERVMSRGVVC